MTHVTCRLTAKNRDQLRNPTLGNRVWATFDLLLHTCTHLLKKLAYFAQVQRVARAVVEYINSQLKVYKNSCATLRLEAVLNAGVTNRTTAVTAEKHVYYTLTLRTSPGDAVFQVAVEWLDGSVRMESDVLRLNSYKEHAGCVQNIVHKKWCYCAGA